MIAHFGIPRSILAHSQNLFSLFNCVCNAESLFAMAATSSMYVVNPIVMIKVPNV